MSSASAAQAIFFQNCCHLFGVSLLIWDYIITIDVESQYLWKRGKSTSAYWFFAIRYGGLAANIPVIIFSLVTLPNKPFVTMLTVMILRIWALYSRGTKVLWWLIGIASSFIAIAVWSMHQGQHGFPLTVLPGCHLAVDESASYHLVGSWECLFAFDAMIFGMTTYKGYVTRRDAGGAIMPIHCVLVRDGAMYFAAMALANLTNIVTFFIGGPLVPGSLATFATWLLSAGYAVLSMSVVMMSRLMLNLHEQTDVGVLTELRMSGIDGELAFAQMESLPLTQAEVSGEGSGVYHGLAVPIMQMGFPD
ncbi:hypothetical protein DFH08DRAFT_1081025 [Mycena albidolilacea]|uniref:DUF6533 domain-containing protein n=1 Tax=Mycena albidolilacea TaxID=1033008 RepID=A0AAD6ZYI4_9AGAR|nr:hypothetical protein DFH08DRAFT_1081025 [Mycena albidolilacea]